MKLLIRKIRTLFSLILGRIFPEKSFSQIQDEIMYVSGKKGIELRKQKYKKFFARYGKEVTIEAGCFFTHPQNIVLEDGVKFNRDCKIYGSGGIYIGSHVRIGPNVFIHSANHKANSNGMPQSQSGYEFKKVSIGEGSLISANVLILPGAEIGKECFFGAGAVVPNRKYDETGRFAGNPANKIKEGNKQIATYSESEKRVALLVPDECGWKDFASTFLSNLGLPQIQVIYESDKISQFGIVFVLGQKSKDLDSKNPIYYIEQSDNTQNEKIHFQLAPDTPKKKESGSIWLLNTLHYAINRLEKANGSYTNEQHNDLDLVFSLLDKYGSQVSQRLRDRLVKLKQAHSYRFIKKDGVGINLIRKICNQDFSEAVDVNETEHLVRSAVDHLGNPKKTWILEGHINKSTYDFTRCLFYSLDESRSYDRSVSLPLILCIASGDAMNFPKTVKMVRGKENFRIKEGKENVIYLDIKSIKNYFLTNKCVESKWHLAEDSYKNNFSVVITKIRGMIRAVFQRHSLPFVQFAPWPAGYSFCFSVRYDVDRPINLSRFNELAAIQRDINGACGSWYLREKIKLNFDAHIELNKKNQELGVHIESGREDIMGKGVTSHSSPDSIYWKGASTYFNCVGSPAYVESLHVDSDYGLFLLDRSGQASNCGLFSTPLHIPLEGTTKDKDLNYYNKYKIYRNQKIKNGGMLIIGSHPDLNQELLEDAIAELDMSKGWKVTIGKAVSRVAAIYSHGNIMCWSRGDKVVLLSKKTIHDLVVLVNGTRYVCALIANVPKTVG